MEVRTRVQREQGNSRGGTHLYLFPAAWIERERERERESVCCARVTFKTSEDSCTPVMCERENLQETIVNSGHQHHTDRVAHRLQLLEVSTCVMYGPWRVWVCASQREREREMMRSYQIPQESRNVGCGPLLHIELCV
ncbi:hypothetical protein GOP47_0004638 [Adiantum capillus-veneris]|uniref:Uncharacterized protein n=1 Tax=Adiantum capillus-veneris TaxID=13818 RepID=A0A9D4V8L5_ADICA|nr:hypothetical protein GOP47_0004638 [Adiantum capillus-veneris]